MIPLGKPKIDSLRIHLPLSEVIVNQEHNSFMRSLTTTNDDGEVLNEHVKTTYFNPDAVISCSYAVRNQFGEQRLFIGFSSKTLKSRYFNGIDRKTIHQCFQFINNEGLITISKESFLAALVVDVDFCVDYYLDSADASIKEVVRICNELTIPSKKLNVGTKRENNNLGIWWGKRDKVGNAYKSKQFLKYYAKAIELKYNSTAFYETYLKDNLNSDLIDLNGDKVPHKNFFEDDRLLRVETTIKDSRHFDTYGYKVKTLKDLLTLNLNPKFLQVFIRPMSTYMTGYRTIKHTEGMTSLDKWQYYAMLKQAKITNVNVEETIPYYVNTFHPDIKKSSSRSNLRTRLYSVIQMNQVVKKTHKHNTQVWDDFITEIEAKKIIPNND